MSYGYDDNDDLQEQDGPKALREALAKANKALEAASRQNAELQSSLNEVKLGNVFSEKKIPAALQRLMKAEKVDASPEAVDAWLSENGSDFGWQPGGGSAEKQAEQQVPLEEAPAAQTQSVLTDEDTAALQRIQGVSTTGMGQTSLSDQADIAVQTIADKLGPNATLDDVIREFKAQGIPTESAFG
jgi:hypothetical protein